MPNGVGGGIGGGIGGAISGIALLAGAAGEGGKPELKKILSLWEKLQEPDFDFSDLTAPELRVMAQATPETFEAQVPAEAALAQESPEIRARQLQALGGLGEIAEEGLPEADRLAAALAGRAVRGAQFAGTEESLRGLRRRGRLGAGAETQARAVGGRMSGQLAGEMGLDLQRVSLERRLQALRDYGGAAGAMRGQDIGLSESRAQALNRFNEFVASQRQQAGAYGAAARERAQAYNVGTAQRIGEANPLLEYQTALQNINRQNQLQQQLFGARTTITGGQAGALGGLAQAGYAEQAARTANIRAIGSGAGQAIGGAFGGAAGGVGGAVGGMGAVGGAPVSAAPVQYYGGPEQQPYLQTGGQGAALHYR